MTTKIATPAVEQDGPGAARPEGDGQGGQSVGHGLDGPQRRQAWMAVVRMARAPSVVQVVHDPLGLLGRDHRADGDPALVVQRRDGRRLQARGERDGLLQVLGAAVVVHHHVRPCDQDALEAAQELLHLGLGVLGGVGADAADDDGLGLHDRVAEDLEARVAQRGAGLDDVRDDLGDAQLDGGLDGAVEVDDGGVDAVVGEVLGDDALVRGGDGLAGEVRDAGRRAGLAGEAEGGAGEAEREDRPRRWRRSRSAGRGR